MADTQWNLAVFNGNADQMLINTQLQLEETIELTARAYAEYAEHTAHYRKLKADMITAELNAGTPATVARETAAGACADAKADMMKAEGQWQRAKALSYALQEKLQTIKYIARRVDSAAQSGV